MRSARSTLLAICVALLCVGVGPLARADTLADFEKGRSSYEGGRYDEAATKFRDMLSPGAERLEPWLLEKVRTYYAACLIALGRFKEADAQIEAILRVNPAGRPDPVVFPSAVLDRFIEVAARIRKDLEADAQRRADEEKLRKEKEAEEKRKERERVAELEKLARQEVHVTHNSRWFALVPFGVGQFQNRQTGLGVTFLGTEAVLATSCIVTSAIVQNLQSKGFVPGIDRQDLNSKVHAATMWNRISWVSFAVVVAGGILHAQLTFVPSEPTIRVRQLPKWLTVQPSAFSVPQGGVVGLQGVF